MHPSDKILFVDDDTRVRRSVDRALRRAGFAVDLAGGPEDALRCMGGQRYGVVATDLRMVGGDGLDLIERARALQPDASSILVTGAADLSLPRGSSRADSIGEILFKPWTSDQLLGAVERGLQRHATVVAQRQVELVNQADPDRCVNLLIVEDSEDDAQLANLYLQRATNRVFEYRLHHCRRLSHALSWLRTNDADAVLVDLCLPDARGLTAVAMIHAAVPDAPIVVLSVSPDQPIAHQCLQIGAQDFLEKGTYGPEALCRSVSFAMERRRACERLQQLASYHQLTGLPNRTLFLDRLTQAIARCSREHKTVGLMYIDLDRFKHVNDTLGHESGDALLKEVANRLCTSARLSDTVAHLSGDEFAIIVEDIASVDEAAAVARRTLKGLRKPFTLGDKELHVTMSVGVALYPESCSMEQLIRDADEAMYRAKRAGRNRFFVHARASAQVATGRRALDSDVARALRTGELVLHYQPKLHLGTGELAGLEALLRWRHPLHGSLSPGEFMPMLEETGLILRVGEWLLREACRQNRAWEHLRVPMAVNLAARQFHDKNIVDVVARVLEDTGLPPGMLELELTESMLFDDPDYVGSILRAFTRCGVVLSVDDFGMGYSSLRCLSRFPIGILKIDRGFVAELPESGSSGKIVSAIVGLGHSLGLQVVAEGVETHEQGAYLQAAGCDFVQGFAYARPMPAPQLEEWAQARSPLLARRAC